MGKDKQQPSSKREEEILITGADDAPVISEDAEVGFDHVSGDDQTVIHGAEIGPYDDDVLDDADNERRQIAIDAENQRNEEMALKLVPVRPRKHTGRMRVGGKFYVFEPGKEQMVPAAVRDWLFEKGVL